MWPRMRRPQQSCVLCFYLKIEGFIIQHPTYDRSMISYIYIYIYIYPRSYQGALFIWVTGLALAMINFVMERLVGFHVLSLHWQHDNDDEDENEVEHVKLPTEHCLPMVPWYTMFIFDTAFQVCRKYIRLRRPS